MQTPESSPLPRLVDLIPEHGFSHPDDAFTAFLDWVAAMGLTLYPHQEQAILELFAGKHVVLDAPTGSGKSLVALALHFKTFSELGRSWYTAPIKALVNEKFFELCRLFGPEHVGMATGDGSINRDAPILCATTEVLANLALREGDAAPVNTVVLDEFHYYGDRDRGMAWQVPLLRLSKTTFLLMSATLGDTALIREDLELRTEREVAEIRGVHRPVPLEFTYTLRALQDTLDDLNRKNRCPVYVVHFTQNEATDSAQSLMSVDWCTRDEKRAIAQAVKGFRFESTFGGTLRRYLLHGVGLHHAGLLPRYRLLVERLAQQGLLKIICGTDTLGVGINVPIRTVLFTKLCKFDGEKVDLLKIREFKQISGRAGRAGFDTQGYVVVQAPEHVIENAKLEARITDPKKLRKAVRAKPPTKGYRHWDENTFHQMVERPPERLESQFRVEYGTLLTLLQHHQERGGDARQGLDALISLIQDSHARPSEREALEVRARLLFEDLERAGVLRPEGDHLVLDPELQKDFSLHYTLSLFLVDALASLDTSSPTFVLELLSFVEAILEDPRPVLYRQAARARGERIMELKAAGVPYEERTEAVEEITWPKPMAEEIYFLFNTWAEHHPWVAGEAIRPKSVVRDMVEQYTSFADYVKDLGLERSEGVLLRYLTEAYKAILQNVPANLRDHEPPTELSLRLPDVLAWLRAMLGAVDASLVAEWELMLHGRKVGDEKLPVDISADRKSFHARIRAELHALVRALSRRDWEQAAALTRRDEDSNWGPEELELAMESFVQDQGALLFDHRARLSEQTTIRAVGPHLWQVSQRLLGVRGQEEEETAVWALEGRVDLRENTNPEGPLVELLRIGE